MFLVLIGMSLLLSLMPKIPVTFISSHDDVFMMSKSQKDQFYGFLKKICKSLLQNPRNKQV